MTEKRNGSRPGEGREPGWQRIQTEAKYIFRPAFWQSSFVARYHRRLGKRLHSKLLRPFQCWRCRALAIDPIGYDGKQKWLCEPCSDPQEGGAL